MEVNTIADCIKLRLLRKIKPDNEKSKKSMELAEKQLKDAKEISTYPISTHAIISAYTSMFHSARAILYRDGIQEKSHFAIFVYLKEKYSKDIPQSVINLINIYRIERHEALYGFDYEPSKADALSAVKDARLFVDSIKKVLKNGDTKNDK